MNEFEILKMNKLANRMTEVQSWGTIYSIWLIIKLLVLYSISLLMSCSFKLVRLIRALVLSCMYMILVVS